jgi:hypothetical protein
MPSTEHIKETIEAEKDKVKFYESFILPISGGCFSLVFTDEFNLLAKRLEMPILYLAFILLMGIHYTRMLSLLKIKKLISQL